MYTTEEIKAASVDKLETMLECVEVEIGVRVLNRQDVPQSLEDLKWEIVGTIRNSGVWRIEHMTLAEFDDIYC